MRLPSYFLRPVITAMVYLQPRALELIKYNRTVLLYKRNDCIYPSVYAYVHARSVLFRMFVRRFRKHWPTTIVRRTVHTVTPGESAAFYYIRMRAIRKTVWHADSRRNGRNLTAFVRHTFVFSFDSVEMKTMYIDGDFRGGKENRRNLPKRPRPGNFYYYCFFFFF